METRDWQEYLSNKLSFSFMAKRIDNTDKVVWRGLKNDKPFSKGHIMKGINHDHINTRIRLEISKKKRNRYAVHALR